MTWLELMELLRSAKNVKEIDAYREAIAERIPAIRVMFDYNQDNRYHTYDLWMHCLHTVVGIDKCIDDDMLYLAALLHDIGKPDCRCYSRHEKDTDAHYPGHPEKSEQIVREVVLPTLLSKGIELEQAEIDRLLYYVKYHDDWFSLDIKHLKRHLELVDVETFKKLMALQLSDAKAHALLPMIQNRIDICTEWINGRADRLMEEIF